MLFLIFLIFATHHRLTETIAGTPDFQRNLSLVQEVQLYLQKLIKCLTTKLYSAPKLDVKHLRAVLKSLAASASAAESGAVGANGETEVAVRDGIEVA